MNEELDALWDNERVDLALLTEGRTSVGGKWVYAIKLDPSELGRKSTRHDLLLKATPRPQE